MSQTVLISGASGFIALHTVKHLLSKGYTVVGSVRSTEKGENIKRLLNNDRFSYDIVKDIGSQGAFDDFVKNHPEATVFLHTASPFTLSIKDIEQDLLKPAIEGTTNALSAIKTYGPQIKKVVVTSSFAAMFDPAAEQNPNSVIDESTWSPLTWETSLGNSILGYCGSKKLAEKAAWNFVETEKPHFTLSTVNPVYVFGPQAFDELVSDKLNTSSEIINDILKLTSPDDSVHPHDGSVVDVRDVADAHIAAFEKEEAQGKRLLLTSESFTQQTILDVLHNDFPEYSKNYPVGTPGSDKEAFAKKTVLNNDWTRRVLGFPLRSAKETIHDSVAQILKKA